MQPINEMTRDELEREIENMQDYFTSCEEIGQGIGSKETVRMRALIAALAATIDISTALDMVADHQAARGYIGLLETLTSMTTDPHLSAIQMAARDVAIGGFQALLAPVGER